VLDNARYQYCQVVQGSGPVRDLVSVWEDR
jgi:hypothetical protein